MIVIATVLGGCGGTALLRGAMPPSTSTTVTTSSTSGSHKPSVYLAALEVEQQKLAVAERQLPHRAPTARALARAITLLRTAIARLAGDLAGLRPPKRVAALHAGLVAAMRLYEMRLAAAVGDARSPSDAAQAANELLSATETASRSFSATIRQIDSRLSP